MNHRQMYNLQQMAAQQNRIAHYNNMQNYAQNNMLAPSNTAFLNSLLDPRPGGIIPVPTSGERRCEYCGRRTTSMNCEGCGAPR